MVPPMPVLVDPVTILSKPAPVTESPDFSDIPPLTPFAAVPVARATAPVPASAFAVDTDAAPLMDELDDPVLKLVDPPVDPVLEPACTFTDPPTVADAPDIRTMSPAEPAEANPVLITTEPDEPSLDPVDNSSAPEASVLFPVPRIAAPLLTPDPDTTVTEPPVLEEDAPLDMEMLPDG